MEKLTVGRYIIGMVQTNFYYMHREGSRETIVFDPADAGGKIFEVLTDQGLTVKAIFLTHAHFDHILGLHDLQSLTGAPVYCSAAEKGLCASPRKNCSQDVGRPVTVEPDIWLEDLQTIEEAGIRLQMIDTPGHTEGSCCYYLMDDGILVTGDTLFQGSVGRADLPTGNMTTLIGSIKTRLLALPDDTVCLPGHGDQTTIGWEKKHNYYL